MQFTGHKKTSKRKAGLKIHLPKYATTKQSPISTLLKNIRWFKMICISCRLDLYNLSNLKTRKRIKTHLIVRIELSINESTKRPQT